MRWGQPWLGLWDKETPKNHLISLVPSPSGLGGSMLGSNAQQSSHPNPSPLNKANEGQQPQMVQRA